MRSRLTIRFKAWFGFLCWATTAVCLAAAGGASAAAQNPATAGQSGRAVVLDQVVAVVNNQAILASDVNSEMRLAVLDPRGIEHGTLTPQRALGHLISRALIQQQIRQEGELIDEPSQAVVDTRLSEIRKDLPACVHFNCASEAGWKAFLTANGLTPQQVETYLRIRIEILSYIELRFRGGIFISPEQIATYYRKTLLPQYAAGEAVPPLDKVAPRIEEILLEQQVNVLFDNWLTNLRVQGDVEVLDPAYKAPETGSNAGQGGA